MIEVLDVPAREIKGTKEGRNYHFFVQKCKLTSNNRDGISETRVFEVQSNPGETYPPASDYIVDPSSCFVGRTDKGRERLMIGAAPRLMRVSDLASATRSSLKAAA